MNIKTISLLFEVLAIIVMIIGLLYSETCIWIGLVLLAISICCYIYDQIKNPRSIEE